MKKLFFIMFIILLLLTCKKEEIKEEKICNCDNPLEELAWLKSLKESITNCYCQVSIIQARYNNQTVFYRVMSDSFCDGYERIALRDCEGDIIKIFESVYNESFYNEVSNRKIIYTCKTNP